MEFELATRSRPVPFSLRLFGSALTGAQESHDVVLSSGFLAFAQHSGFLQAVEEVRPALWSDHGQLAGVAACSARQTHPAG